VLTGAVRLRVAVPALPVDEGVGLGVGRNELGEQSLHSLVYVVDDRSDLFDREAGGVGQVPVDVAFAGVDGAGITAAHGDDDIRGPGDLVGEGLGKLLAGVEAAFGQEGDDRGVDLVAGVGAGGADFDPASGVVVEQDPGGDAAARVVGTHEQHDGNVFHDDFLGLTDGANGPGEAAHEAM
jgi:hypothetical protein